MKRLSRTFTNHFTCGYYRKNISSRKSFNFSRENNRRRSDVKADWRQKTAKFKSDKIAANGRKGESKGTKPKKVSSKCSPQEMKDKVWELRWEWTQRERLLWRVMKLPAAGHRANHSLTVSSLTRRQGKFLLLHSALSPVQQLSVHIQDSETSPDSGSL